MPSPRRRGTTSLDTSTGPRLVSLKDAADYAGCIPRTIRRRVADGSLTGYRFGPRLIRVDLNELEALIRPIPTGTDTP